MEKELDNMKKLLEKNICQVIQKMTIFFPIVRGLLQQPLKWSLNNPKRVTKNCQDHMFVLFLFFGVFFQILPLPSKH